MTAQQKIKWAILLKYAQFSRTTVPEVTAENVDELYDNLVAEELQWDAKNEVRCSGTETGLPCSFSRHYESDWREIWRTRGSGVD
jgi:hypothetical protein